MKPTPAEPSELRRYLFLAGPWTVGIVLFVQVLVEGATDVAQFLRNFAVAFVIAEVTMALSFWGTWLVAHAEYLYYCRRKIPYKEVSQVRHILRSTVFILPGMYLGFAVVGLVAPYLGVEWRTPDIAGYRYGLVVAGVSLLAAAAVELNRSRRLSEEHVKLLERQSLQAQVAALTSQMNPHLLFNALNSIASMIKEQPDAAEDMTVALSVLYRRVLQASKSDTHRLIDELELCRAFVEIEKARFEERLAYAIDVDPSVDPERIDVPVLCLQPFVENAVKHGLLPKLEGGRMTIRVLKDGDVLLLEVLDDGVGLGKAPASKGSGTAVQNCRERLVMLYGDRSAVILEPLDRGTLVRIRIPLPARSAGA